MPNYCDAGFSLIELMVVILIIGLGTSFVAINVGGDGAFKMRAEAQKFANGTALIAEEAVLSNSQWGVNIYRQVENGVEQYGYRWLTQSETGRWVLANDEDLDVDFLFSPGTELRLQLEGVDEDQEIAFKQELTQAESEGDVLEDDEDATQVIDELVEEDSDEEDAIDPDIWIFSSGEMSAFKLTLSEKSNPGAELVVEGDELGRVSLNRGVEDESEDFDDDY